MVRINETLFKAMVFSSRANLPMIAEDAAQKDRFLKISKGLGIKIPDPIIDPRGVIK